MEDVTLEMLVANAENDICDSFDLGRALSSLYDYFRERLPDRNNLDERALKVLDEIAVMGNAGYFED